MVPVTVVPPPGAENTPSSPATAPAPLAAAARRLAAGVDVWLHDAQVTAAERGTADASGHATVDDAIAFSEQCGARMLVRTDHAPSHTDTEPDRIARCVAGRTPRVMVAIQGTVTDVR